MCFETTEQAIKDAVWNKMNEEALQEGHFPQIGTVVDFRPLFVKFHIC